MQYLKISIGIFLALAASRFIPHPPNFTSLLALSFYVPAIFGVRFIPALVLSFLITDLIIGFHETILFTWGSVILIGIISKYFNRSILLRLFGALVGAVIFYLLSNFGVWTGGLYEYDIAGLITCYTLALPFFGNTLISTLVFSVIVEILYKSYKPIKEYAYLKI
jgi:hypothetical protein